MTKEEFEVIKQEQKESFRSRKAFLAGCQPYPFLATHTPGKHSPGK